MNSKELTSFRIIILGYFSLILMGGFLLHLPIAQVKGQATPFLDALFTATSAGCVTGLIVHNTATYWSIFGKVVILILIQIGGLGIITVTLAFSLMTGKKIGLLQRSIMQESISAFYMGGIVRFTSFILKTVLGVELLGAVCLFPTFYQQFGLAKGALYAIFHSISAFCNAGFDLLGIQKPYVSLTAYQDNVPVNLTIMLLILIGGIGFRTWQDVRDYKWHFNKYCLQSKLVLAVSVILLVLPFTYFYICEFQTLPLKERILAALFTTISPRTAGFNTVSLNQLSDDGIIVNIILMLIGGSTGSTAGGIKMNTVAVILLATHAVLHHKQDITVFGRRIALKVVDNATAICTLYLGLDVIGALIISHIENINFLTGLFETTSAIATVGLTLGITPHLGDISKCILIILMFIGRVGGMNLAFAMVVKKNNLFEPRYPTEDISVG